jgi:Protein of unknown function (DUF2730)
MDWFLKYWPILLFVFNVIGALVLLALHKTYAKKEEIVALDKRLAVSEQAIAITEKAIAEMDTHNIELQLKELKGEFDGMNRLLNRAANQLDMLVENELKG